MRTLGAWRSVLPLVALLILGGPRLWARPSTCAQILRSHYTAAPLRDTPSGQLVYKEIKHAMRDNPTTFRELNQYFEGKNPTVRDVLKFIQTDRARLIFILSKLQSKVQPDDPVHWLLANVLRNITSNESLDTTDDQRLREFDEKYGDQLWWNWTDSLFNHKVGHKDGAVTEAEKEAIAAKKDEYFICKYYQKNYSFISEILTALEVKGLVAADEHIDEMIPEPLLEQFKKRLVTTGHSDLVHLMYLEIDAVSVDQKRGEMTWFEVKHANTRLERETRYWNEKLERRTENLKKLIKLISEDSQLRAVFPYRIKIRFVIRGGGIAKHMAEHFRHELGVVVEDQGVEAFNRQFGVLTNDGSSLATRPRAKLASGNRVPLKMAR